MDLQDWNHLRGPCPPPNHIGFAAGSEMRPWMMSLRVLSPQGFRAPHMEPVDGVSKASPGPTPTPMLPCHLTQMLAKTLASSMGQSLLSQTLQSGHLYPPSKSSSPSVQVEVRTGPCGFSQAWTVLHTVLMAFPHPMSHFPCCRPGGQGL